LQKEETVGSKVHQSQPPFGPAYFYVSCSCSSPTERPDRTKPARPLLCSFPTKFPSDSPLLSPPEANHTPRTLAPELFPARHRIEPVQSSSSTSVPRIRAADGFRRQGAARDRAPRAPLPLYGNLSLNILWLCFTVLLHAAAALVSSKEFSERSLVWVAVIFRPDIPVEFFYSDSGRNLADSLACNCLR
jgi:hypothetical protein